jgi:hypothetical protein
MVYAYTETSIAFEALLAVDEKYRSNVFVLKR